MHGQLIIHPYAVYKRLIHLLILSVLQQCTETASEIRSAQFLLTVFKLLLQLFVKYLHH